MAKIYDVAYYILQKKPGITTMKLQKLCYYAQAWSLVWDELPLFDEEFEAWANGPVCKELYLIHRGQFTIFADELKDYAKTELSDEQKETIDIILNDYGNETPHYLSELTHKERPWKETRGNLPAGSKSNSIIPKELMQEYYSGLLI